MASRITPSNSAQLLQRSVEAATDVTANPNALKPGAEVAVFNELAFKSAADRKNLTDQARAAVGSFAKQLNDTVKLGDRIAKKNDQSDRDMNPKQARAMEQSLKSLGQALERAENDPIASIIIKETGGELLQMLKPWLEQMSRLATNVATGKDQELARDSINGSRLDRTLLFLRELNEKFANRYMGTAAAKEEFEKGLRLARDQEADLARRKSTGDFDFSIGYIKKPTIKA